MFKRVLSVVMIACICIGSMVSSNNVYAETSSGEDRGTGQELFNESYAGVEGNLSTDWVKANGVGYNADSMELYRPAGDDGTKQLERKFSEDTTGVVTIEYEFANIATDESTKPVQLELKAKDVDGNTVKPLIMHYAGNKVKVKGPDNKYSVIKTVTLNEKNTAKIVVDTNEDKLYIGINGDEPTEYPLFQDKDLASLSSIYWVIAGADKIGAGFRLYSMKATVGASGSELTDEEKIQADLDDVEITGSAVMKVDFTVSVSGKNGSVISWESSNDAAAEVNNSTGMVTVKRSDSDQNVKLTATGQLNGKSLTKEFDIIVAKLATNDEKIQADLDAIMIATPQYIRDDFKLPLLGTINDAVLSWESDNAAVAIDNGTGEVTVTRADSNQKVKLTVTGELDGETATRVFDIRVISSANESTVLFDEDFGTAGDDVSTDWTTLKGETYATDCMTLYRSYTDTATKQLKRTFNEDANGVVTIEYEFANIGENTKPVQFFLKAKNADDEEVTILTTQHTPTVVRVKTVSESGQVVYKNLKDVNPTQKYTAKIVVDTILDTVTLTIDDQTQEYEIDGNEDIKNVSLMYWTITSDKKDTGINLYNMKTTTYVSDELKVASDLAKITLDEGDSIKENFELPLMGNLGSTLTWEADKPDVVLIDNGTGNAVITRGQIDQTVKLTVTSTLNDVSDTKEFQVTIRKMLTQEEENVEKDKESLSINSVVTSDLLLIRTGEYGSKITWESSDAAVITDNGEVTIGDEDKNVTLTATLVYGSVTDTKEFNVLVPKVNTSSRPAQKESNMTDEEFLGIWHSETGEWIMKPKMNYDYENDPTLKAVEESVKKGDYEEAKELLLEYYVLKDRQIENPSNKRENTSSVDDLLNDFYCKLTKYDTTQVSSEEGYSTFDLTEMVSEKVSVNRTSLDFVIINEDKNEEVIFNSREGDNPPVLTIVADGKTYNLDVRADTYIRGGKNGNKNYGTEEYLKALDSGMPVDDNSKRIYISFELPEIPATAVVESAELSLYGFARVHDPENPNESNVYDQSVKLDGTAKLIIAQSEELDFNETSVKWNAPLRIRHYSYKGNTEPYGGMDYLHTNKPGMDKQYVNTYARFWHQEGLIGKYEETGDEVYAARYIRELLVYYTKVGGGDLLVKPDLRGTNTQLNAGFREQIISDSYYAIVKSESMTADDNLQILKFIYDDAEALLLPFYWEKSKNNNWGMEMTVGNQSVIENFPEFATTEKNLDIIADRMSFLLGNLIRTDGAYIEGTNGYPVHIFENIYAYNKAMQELNYTVPESLEIQIKRFGTFFINCMEPNGYVAEYGDDHYDQKFELYEEIAELAELGNDMEMLYVATYGEEGVEPLHQSAFYPDGRWATMRNGWDEDSIFSFANWMPIDTHSHNDVLGLTLTAYGRRLLADTSDKSYNNDPISNWQRVSRFSHNVVAIDDISGYEMYKSNWSNPNLSSSANSNFTDAHDILTMQLVEKEMPSGDYVSDRKIVFLKPLDFLIVSDHLDAVAGEHKYTQTWIFDPLALPSIESETGVLRTNFETGANVLVVPDSNAGMTQSIEDGYHGAESIEYGKFVKNSGAVETFDTVIYPIKEGEQTEVVTSKIDMGDNKLVSAMTIEVKKDANEIEKGAYYITHEENPSYRTFGDCSTDATMAYVNNDSQNNVNYALMQNGTVLQVGDKVVVKSDVVLSDISVEYVDDNINITSSEKVLSNLGKIEILATEDVEYVKFNGVIVEYDKLDGVISLKADERNNLAYGKAVVGAGVEVIDGDANTSWEQSTREYPATVTIDLGEEKDIKEVEVLWGLSETQNGVYNYKLQTSLDGTNFVDVKEDRGFERSLIKTSSKVRYIKLVITDNTFYDPIEIREIYVYDVASKEEEVDSGDVNNEEEENGTNVIGKSDSVVVTVEKEEVDKTVEDLIGKMEELQQTLSEEEFEEFKKDMVVTIPVAGVTGEDDVAVSLPLDKETLEELQKLGVGIELDLPGTNITIPSGAIPSDLLEQGGDIVLKREVLDDVDAEKMLEQLDKELRSTGQVYDFGLTVGGQPVSKFEEPIIIKTPLPSDVDEQFDTRKLMFCNIGENGEVLDAFPGKIVDGQFVAEVGHYSVYTLLENNKSFTDVVGRWSQDVIEVCASRNIVKGVSDDLFAPEQTITRGEFAAMLGRSLNLKGDGSATGFIDIKADAYYAEYVAALKDNGLVSGYDDDTFRPDQEMTRQEMVKMIVDAYVFITNEELETKAALFTDMDSAATWAKDRINAAYNLDIVHGVGDGRFDPEGTATREEVAKMIVGLLEKSGSM